MTYAIEAVLFIAYHSGGAPVQSREIARRQGIPQRYLEQVMQQLVREGVLKGVRGPRGGYTVARERRRITVAEIVRIVDAADDEDAPPASELGEKVSRPLWREAQEAVLTELEKVTMQELKALSKEDRDELGELCRIELGCESTKPN